MYQWFQENIQLRPSLNKETLVYVLTESAINEISKWFHEKLKVNFLLNFSLYFLVALISRDETLRESTCQYLREVAVQTKKFEHELLKSVLVMFLNLPKFLLKESSILKCLQLPIRQVFVHSHLNLIEIGIGKKHALKKYDYFALNTTWFLETL